MSHSKGELNSDKQILYLVQWFAEFSEFQRQDFLLDHLSKLYGHFFQKTLFQLNCTNGNVQNGSNLAETEEKLLENEQNSDSTNSDNLRPPSIFQCRMKLFKEWFETQWNEQDRVEFLLRLKNVDSEFIWTLYRNLLKENNLLDREKLIQLFDESANDSSRKILAERLDLFNETIFVNRVKDVEQTPDLLANCLPKRSNEERLSPTVPVSNGINEVVNDAINSMEELEINENSRNISESDSSDIKIKESPPDILA